jgi:hypothetical protein
VSNLSAPFMFSPIETAHFHFLDDVVADVAAQNRCGLAIDLFDLLEVLVHDALQDNFDKVVVEGILRFQTVCILVTT